MKPLVLEPIRRVSGEILLPGSKSISNRVLLLSALSRGTTEIGNLLFSDDTEWMCKALRQLNVAIDTFPAERRCRITGNGRPFDIPRATLYLGNAGTAMRSLCAAMCLGGGKYTLTGNARMCERPIGDLVETLRTAGADIAYMGTEGYPPLEITARGLNGARLSIDGGISSQFLTAVLLASPLARNETVICVNGALVSRPYVDITIDLMRQFGVEVRNEDYASFTVPRVDAYSSPNQITVEGDASSASYFLSAAAIRGGTVRVCGVGSDSAQGDIRHASVLEAMGAKVRWGANWIEVTRGELHGIDMDFADMPDAAMTVAVTALFAEGKTTLRNIYNWRVKETDRLSAMAAELTKLGATVHEGKDFLEILPPATIRSATIDTYDDHRMAMAFSLAALGRCEIVINDPGCVSKTFPDFFDTLESIAQR